MPEYGLGAVTGALCAEIALLMSKKEANIAVIKSTVDTNLEGITGARGKGKMTTDVTRVFLECLRLRNENTRMGSDDR